MKKKSCLMQRIQISLLAVLVMCGHSCSSQSNSESEADKLSYLAVQMEVNGNWSIIDANGKVVVKDEYPADNVIGIPSENGLYWVLANGKYSLYSVESPKKQISSVEYDNVTDFNDGRAFVSIIGEPIQMIDEAGKVIKTLSEDVKTVNALSDGMAIYKSSESDLYGYLNSDGEVVVEPKYIQVRDFCEGFAVAQDNSNNWQVVNKSGKIVEDWGKSQFFCIETYRDGVFAAIDTTDWYSLYYIDIKGNIAIKPIKKAIWYLGGISQRYLQGTAIAFDENKNPGLIDKNGDFLIRFGKYKYLNRLDGNYFTASNPNGHTGVIDKDENIIVPFNYSHWEGLSIGDNFILKLGTDYVLVNRNGKELIGCKYVSLALIRNSLVNFVNVKANVKAIVDLFTLKGYQPLAGKRDMPSVAKKYELEVESLPQYARSFTTNVKVGDWEATTDLLFNGYLMKELYHTEVQNDGWFANEVTVSDGLGWNDEALLDKVTLKVPVETNINMEDLKEQINKKFIEKGFKQEDSILYTKDGDTTISLLVSSDENCLRIEYLLKDE